MDFATDHLEETIVGRDIKQSKPITNTLGHQSLTLLPSLLTKRSEALATGNDPLVMELDERINALRAAYRRR